MDQQQAPQDAEGGNIVTAKSLKTPIGIGVAALVAFVLLLIVPPLAGANGSQATAALQSEAKPTSSPTPTPTPTGPCVGSWPMKSAAEADHTNNRWFYEGIAEIKSAVTPEEATKAAGVFVEKIKEFPHLLAGASKVILGEDVDKTALVNKDGCATDKAVEIHTELGLALATAKSITANEAPTDAWNTGVQNESVVGSQWQGIDGDRKAIQITLADGRTVWVLARCGNIATPGKPPVPEGPTDQPPPPPTCPPGTVGTPPDCVAPKPSDPTQWVYPTEKPKVTITEPNPSDPAPVETTRPGGGGTTDTPSNPPGSETGVTTPDKEPPAPERTNPPAPEVTQPPAPPGDPGGF